MENLKVVITFKSGRKKEVMSHDYYKGQFRKWIESNFIQGNGTGCNFVVWNDSFVNVNEIETIDEL